MRRIALAIWFAGVGSAAADPVLTEAISGNTVSLAAIRNASVKMTLKLTPGGKETPGSVYAIEYWRDNDFVRARQTYVVPEDVGQVIEYSCRGGIQRSVIRKQLPQPNAYAVSLLIAREGRPTLGGDPWKYALCGIPPFDSESKPLPSAAEACRRMAVKSAVKDSVSGRPAIRVTLDDGGTVYEVWFDPAVNWLIRKVVRTTPQKGDNVQATRTEYEVEEFGEVRPTIFFPLRTVVRAYRGGKLSVTQEATFRDVVINGDKPPLPLLLPIVAGMAATDEIRGVTYTANANGEPAGKLNVLRHAPATGLSRRPTEPADQPGLASSASFWFAVAGGVLLAAATLMKVRRR